MTGRGLFVVFVWLISDVRRVGVAVRVSQAYASLGVEGERVADLDRPLGDVGEADGDLVGFLGDKVKCCDDCGDLAPMESARLTTFSSVSASGEAQAGLGSKDLIGVNISRSPLSLAAGMPKRSF